ncbi:MAG: DNA mismatch repair protein MutS [Pseudomonadota bacterium]
MPQGAPNDAATPMLRQYLRIKAEHPDAILMFRLGDFYEMFFEDAEIASKLLDITLTSRNRNDPNPVPLCGVPYHSVEPYIAKLLESGKKVAICDQVEDPKFAKGVVKREVTRVVTPGVILDGLGVEAGSHNFLAAAFSHGGSIGMAIADASTGLFQAAQFATLERLIEEMGRVEPREILLPDELRGEGSLEGLLRRLLPAALFTRVADSQFDATTLMRLEGAAELVARSPAAARAASGILAYLDSTQKGASGHIMMVAPYAGERVMRLDESTKRNLELLRTMREGSRHGSLIEALDRSSTAVGARKLKSWLLYPLTHPAEINSRLDAVEAVNGEARLLRDLPSSLKRISDMERITSRASACLAHARDLAGLKESLEAVADLKKILEGSSGLLALLAGSIDPHAGLSRAIGERLVDDPPLSLKEGGLIRTGFSPELDEMRDIIAHGKDFIAGLEAKERKATGIGSLKIRYNRVFGYYIEVTNAHREKVPESYIRKQTLANAERYITPELKEYEEKILGAEEKGRALEQEIFCELRSQVAAAAGTLLATADAIATLDALTSLALIAAEYDYRRPEVDGGDVIDIRDGRHPIVERANPTERFVPNDVFLGEEKNLLMITGPNMAGKSTVMRQTALIVLMAQMGSFVPASSARIGAVDRIFTRVGASDALSQGQSTFMVEMSEAATILREATEKSLIVIDEIGRGTSTFDGLSIAWAVAEDLHDRVRARTMFATHYHELTELALTKPRISNMHIAVKEWNGEVIFLRRLLSGATSRSYGLQVARLAGLPEVVIDRAREVLSNLESGELDEVGKPRLASSHRKGETAKEAAQYHLFTQPLQNDVAKKLSEIDTRTMTPLEALNILHELAGMIKPS